MIRAPSGSRRGSRFLLTAAAALLLPLLLLLSSCAEGRHAGDMREGGAESPQSPLLVLAASDLQAAFAELVPLYRERTGEAIEVVLGSTGTLAAQVRHGAPADLFFAADESFLDALIAGGHVISASRRAYAVGRLVLVARPSHPPPGSVEALSDPRYEVIALANPEHAPYGMAARESMRSAGVWERLGERLVLGDNIAHTLQFVQTGNADAGIVALGLVRGVAGSQTPYTLVEDGLHAPLRQAAGVLTGSTRAARAGAFLDFVLSQEGQALLDRYGFERPS